VERLRIEEEHVLEESRRNQSQPSLRRSGTLLARRRLRKKESLKQNQLAVQADAEFFLSLPEKVQRTTFSREEQILLVGSYNPSSVPSPLPLYHEPQPIEHFRDFQFNFPPSRGRSRARASSVESVSPCRPSISRQPAHVFEDPERSPYLDIMSSKSNRTMSLSNLPHAFRTSTSSAPHVESHLPQRPAWHQRAYSQSVSGRRSSHVSVAPAFDPEAIHYRHPQARKKLRDLVSPQKFDEAVEFGFAPTQAANVKPANVHLPPISTDNRNFSRDMQNFLNDDRISFLDDDEDEDRGLESDLDSMADLDSPVTPCSGLSFRQTSSNFSSIDSNGLPAHHLGRPNREMTLRMTLTRPDLRADEEQLYGWQATQANSNKSSVNHDPFALEELHLSDDMTGSKGPFYVKPKPQGNLVSRLFRRHNSKKIR
jgi:hypothetical protein